MKNKLEKIYEYLCNLNGKDVNLFKPADVEADCLEISEPYEDIYAQVLLKLEDFCTSNRVS